MRLADLDQKFDMAKFYAIYRTNSNPNGTDARNGILKELVSGRSIWRKRKEKSNESRRHYDTL